MTLVLALSLGGVVAAGVLLLLSRDVFRIIVGLAVLGSAVNVAVFLTARPGTLVPAVIEADATTLAEAATHPLPQALVLTAIVIGFALLAFALVLGARLAREAREDTEAFDATEPAATDAVKPALEEEGGAPGGSREC